MKRNVIPEDGLKRIASKVAQFDDAELDEEITEAWRLKGDIEMYLREASESPNYSALKMGAQKARTLASILDNLAGIMEEENIAGAGQGAFG